VAHGDAIRAVDIKGLCLGICTAACGRVSKMTEPHEAWEVGHAGAIVENLGSHAVALALVEAAAAIAADNASGILPTVLEEVKPIMDLDSSRVGFPSVS